MKRSGLLIASLGIFLFAQVAQADWSAVRRLTWTSGGSHSPDIAVDSNKTIHVVWEDTSPFFSDIYYKRSTDGGANWNGVKNLTRTSGGSSYPAIAADSNNRVHVVWCESTADNKEEIYYVRSTDGGTTWSAVKGLTWTSGSSYNPAIACGPNNLIHIVWRDYTPGNAEIYYKKSTDGGTTWGAVKRLTWTAGESGCPAIAADSNNHVHVVWHDYTPGWADIYYRKSTDGGITWSVVKKLTWDPDLSYGPAIAVGSNNHLHLVWHDFSPGNAEIFYKKSTDGGASWSVIKRLTWTSGDSFLPAIARDSNNHVHVVWYRYTSSNNEIYYRQSTDGGTTWGASERLTWTKENSHYPAIAVDSDNAIHVVWEDYTPGNYEIYYRKGM